MEMLDSRSLINISNVSFKVFELVEKYKNDGLIFPEIRARNDVLVRITRESLNALLLGIPFPSICFSELQNGKLLVMDSSDKLRGIIGFLAGKISLPFDESLFYSNNDMVDYYDLIPDVKQDIFRSVIQTLIIRYDTPAFLQMYIGNYIGDFSISHSEAIRRELYANRGMEEIQNAMHITGKGATNFVREYNFIVFLSYVSNFRYMENYKNDFSFYQLEERMFDWIKGKYELVIDLYMLFDEARLKLRHDAIRERHFSTRLSEIRLLERKYSNFSPFEGHILGLAAVSCNISHYSSESIVCKIDDILFRLKSRDYILDDYMKKSNISYNSLVQIINHIR